MDKLSNYIQNGKPVKFLNITSIFICIGVILGLISYFILNHMVQTTDFQKLIERIPAFEIQKGQIQRPENLVWKEQIPYTNAIIMIDTTRDEFLNFPHPNGLYFSKTKYYAVNKGQVQVSPYPDETIIFNNKIIQENIPTLMRGLSMAIGGIIFIILGIGYIGTILLLRLHQWIFRRNNNRQILLRAALIGWLSIFILNVILRCLGHGLGVFPSIILATAIALFALYITSPKD